MRPASCATSVTGRLVMAARFMVVIAQWTCASIRPGISVRPARSTRCASRAAMAPLAHLDDALALDEHRGAVAERAGLDVEQARVLEQELGHGDLAARCYRGSSS